MHGKTYLQITTTCDDRQALEQLARLLIAEKIAACAQLSGPLHSHYWWEGKCQSAEEWQLQVKTRDEFQAAVYELVAKNHPYRVPQLVTTRLEHVAADYASWIDESLKPAV